MENSFNNLDGEVSGLIEYDAQLASSPVKGNPFDAENFYPLDGDAYGNDLAGEEGGLFDYATGDPLFSNAKGKKRKKRRGAFEKVMSYTPFGFIKKGIDAATSPEARERRLLRAKAKLESAQGQKIAASSLGKESKSDIELAKALRAPALKQTKQSKGLSTGAKIGITVGVVAVLGVVGYFIYRAAKKK